MTIQTKNIIWLNQLRLDDIDHVGGKNASLGEMIQSLDKAGVKVPGGFATTSEAYQNFLKHENLGGRINDALDALDINDLDALARTGKQIREWVLDTPFQDDFNQDIEQAWDDLVAEYGDQVSWAVRSSATAEDLPDASFAGQQETFLNVTGLEHIKHSIHKVFASLFTDRAISYRVHQGFDHALVSLSAGVQKMIRSDLASSGVMFSIDTESGNDKIVFVTGSYGLGEMVVQGAVNPDEFYVYKPNIEAGKKAVIRRTVGSKQTKMIFASNPADPVTIVDTLPAEQNVFCINDEQVEELAHYAMLIEQHYGRPMDIEWAMDGEDQQLYIVQARPETVQSQRSNQIEQYRLKGDGEVVVEGRSIGNRIGNGVCKVINSLDQMDEIKDGDVLVTDMTDPDWEPIMKRASAIVTNRGGRTCHAAIIARELGVPAVVGCIDATEQLTHLQPVTVSCAEGDVGKVYDGIIDYDLKTVSVDKLPEIATKVMQNVGNPDRAFEFAQLPHQGVGLARMEFIINHMIGIHPNALLDIDAQDEDVQALIKQRINSYPSARDFFVEKIVEGVSSIASVFAPETVILRLSDFKSNEYAKLIGGPNYEPHEENPMIGFRGASRYIDEKFKACFEMECAAIKKVREEYGLDNLHIMVPFVRTLEEAEQVSGLLAENGLARGDNGLQHMMMCEIPSNALLAEEFLEYFDGFSIGSNDMTQLTLGLDRDSEIIADTFDERNPAVKKMISMAIEACNKQGKYVGICGQGPSDHPDLAEWLMEQGISSISLNPDTVIETWIRLGEMK